MADRTILAAQGATDAPFAYTVPTADGMTPKAVFVEWDGTGASGNFLPCVSYYDQHGILLYRAFPDGVTLAPGDTAAVSYGPFKRGGGGGGGADPHAIHYDTAADTGGYVDSRTTTGGYSWADRSGSGWNVDSGLSGTPGFVGTETNGGQVFDHSALIIQRIGNRFEIQNDSAQVRFRVFTDGSTAQRLEAGAQLAVVSIATGLVLAVREDGQVVAPKLPIVDPGVSGSLWNNGGVVNVSP